VTQVVAQQPGDLADGVIHHGFVVNAIPGSAI
jgi:hypothetical protein